MKNLLKKIYNPFYDLFSLLYPETCAACGIHLFRNERCLCTRCLYHLPKTNFHLLEENPVEKLFWGRVNIEKATSLFFYEKGGRYQNVVYKLKYKGQKEIGVDMGRMFGSELANSPFNAVDCLVPVPLHPSRLKHRGYNQSEYIARGISEQLQKPLLNSIAYRTRKTETQTRRSRYERLENVEGAFQIQNMQKIMGKTILLIDDVVTTGATLEACAQTILNVPDTRVFVATLGFAKR